MSRRTDIVTYLNCVMKGCFPSEYSYNVSDYLNTNHTSLSTLIEKNIDYTEDDYLISEHLERLQIKVIAPGHSRYLYIPAPVTVKAFVEHTKKIKDMRVLYIDETPKTSSVTIFIGHHQ